MVDITWFGIAAVGEGPWWVADVEDEAPVDAKRGLANATRAKKQRRSRTVLRVRV